MSFGWSPSAADRRLLPEGRLAGPMPWVIAIMIFLTVLATAAGLGLSTAADTLRASLAGRVTIQIVEANPDLRESQSRAVLAALKADKGVKAASRVDPAQMAALLEPWLGASDAGTELPMPALIDVDLNDATPPAVAALRAGVQALAPAARVDEHGRWLAPLAGLIGSLTLLTMALVLLMAIATSAVVVLAARAALNTHRATIDVLHLLGATDIQIARLFQRRIALDALFGGFVGLGVGLVVIFGLGIRMNAVGSELLGAIRLDWTGLCILVAIPLAGALLATLAARLTAVKALRRIL
ncbi:MAG: cell division protein [Sphingomonas sp. SCN 67-18]|uniref:cell division protein FtsX n=1 Tax=uncultured Sphingomonas sp. TaxID=158754 RepID=UPI00086EDB5C|nr:FtsX-like permease family protein [Sphingomonas sp. SCN 67-18]ODU20199.1 MAG: cell division protein [Sphingomonas sp. SCN 67-18]